MNPSFGQYQRQAEDIRHVYEIICMSVEITQIWEHMTRNVTLSRKHMNLQANRDDIHAPEQAFLLQESHPFASRVESAFYNFNDQ